MRTIRLALFAGSMLAGLPAMAAEMDWSKVDQALGKTGAAQPGEVHKYALPRTDLHVTVDSVEIKPALALGGWLAFRPMGAVTAVHNHLLRSQPATFYMHVVGQGHLATAIHDALGASKTPFGRRPPPRRLSCFARRVSQPSRSV
jgi:hypothetical protein